MWMLHPQGSHCRHLSSITRLPLLNKSNYKIIRMFFHRVINPKNKVWVHSFKDKKFRGILEVQMLELWLLFMKENNKNIKNKKKHSKKTKELLRILLHVIQVPSLRRLLATLRSSWRRRNNISNARSKSWRNISTTRNVRCVGCWVNRIQVGIGFYRCRVNKSI